MPAVSAGLLLYRVRADADADADADAGVGTGVGVETGAGIRVDAGLEVLIVHPGGPFWAKRDAGAWSIPKGEHGPDEEPLAAARREFAEELGSEAPDGPDVAVLDLGEVRLRSGKRVRGFGVAGDLDADAIASNTFALEWPPRSGRTIEVPEVDRAAWVSTSEAARRLNPAQVAFVDRLLEALGLARAEGSGGPEPDGGR